MYDTYFTAILCVIHCSGCPLRDFAVVFECIALVTVIAAAISAAAAAATTITAAATAAAAAVGRRGFVAEPEGRRGVNGCLLVGLVGVIAMRVMQLALGFDNFI